MIDLHTFGICGSSCAPPRVARWQPQRRWAWPLAAAIVVWALAQVAVAWVWRDDVEPIFVMLPDPVTWHEASVCVRDPQPPGGICGEMIQRVNGRRIRAEPSQSDYWSARQVTEDVDFTPVRAGTVVTE